MLQRLESIGLEEKQRLIALLDVQIDLEPNGAFTVSMVAPSPTDPINMKYLCVHPLKNVVFRTRFIGTR